MPKTKPPYPPEFRREALELLKLSGKPLPQIARTSASQTRRFATGAARPRSTPARLRA